MLVLREMPRLRKVPTAGFLSQTKPRFQSLSMGVGVRHKTRTRPIKGQR